MILENGVIRTLDPSLPVARALAIAGEKIAGGVGTHETALARPRRRSRRPLRPPRLHRRARALPEWALAQRQVRLEGTRSLDEAVARVATRCGDARPGAGSAAPAGGAASGSRPSTRRSATSTPSPATRPAALMAKDGHSLWLNSAALARADGDLQVPGGVVELDERGEPTGVLREESAWEFRGASCSRRSATTSGSTRCARASSSRSSRGVTSVHDKDGWLGDLRLFQRCAKRARSTCACGSRSRTSTSTALEPLDFCAGLGDDWLRAGYLKAFMDGTLGSQTARMLDGSGVEITSREELEQIVRRGARIGWPVAVHAIGDRANREALDAFEATRDEWAPSGLRPRIEHAQCLAPEDLPRFAQLGVAARSSSPRASRPRSRRPLLAGQDRRRVRVPLAAGTSGAVVANGSDAPIEELDPLAGIRAGVLRTIDERRAWHPEQAADRGEGARGDVRRTGLARRATSDARGRLLPG